MASQEELRKIVDEAKDALARVVIARVDLLSASASQREETRINRLRDSDASLDVKVDSLAAQNTKLLEQNTKLLEQNVALAEQVAELTGAAAPPQAP